MQIGIRILSKGFTSDEAKEERGKATDELRKFMVVVLHHNLEGTDFFEGIKVTDDGVIRHHGDLFDISGLVNKIIDTHPGQLLDLINLSAEAQVHLQNRWRTFNQRYIWPALRWSPRLAKGMFKMYERWQDPSTPWTLTQLRMMEAVNGNLETPHPNPIIISGHTHIPIIAKHPDYKGTAVSLGGWDGEIHHPVLGIREADRFLMAEFNPVTGWE